VAVPVSDQDAARAALQRVLASAAFSRNERQSRFLTFLVERHLDGRGHELKESVIAVEVFDRPPDYDPKVDAIVRTEAVRLRARLAKYYEAEGRLDTVTIELPKGGYRPVFRERPFAQATPAPVARRVLRPAAAVLAVTALIMGTAWWSLSAKRAPVAVAVLPLENLTRDAGSDYFADGLTDEIIRNLSVIEGLTVRSRTSSFSLKGKALDAVEAGKQLGANYLLEGSVLQAGDRLRVNVAFVSTRDGSQLWSGRYDRKLTDVFAIQDEISRGIVDTLRLTLSGRRRYEANLAAYDQYLRGRQMMAAFPMRVRPIAIRAIEFFERAIAIDPNYALAYAGMADTFIAVDHNLGNANKIEAWPRAKSAAMRAVELDPMLSEAQSALAAIRAREYAWEDAERGFRRAIELNPNNALAHLQLGGRVLVVQGRFDEGLEEARRAVALDPLSPFVITEAGEAFMLAGRHEEAIAQFRSALALDPTRNKPYHSMARALSLQGRFVEAREALQRSISLGGPPSAAAWLACVDLRAGLRQPSRALLEDLRNSIEQPRSLPPVFGCLQDPEHALAVLEAAAVASDPRLPEVLRAPELIPLRSHPRFAALRQALDLRP
jgi:serine/threonine-protein kinase